MVRRLGSGEEGEGRGGGCKRVGVPQWLTVTACVSAALLRRRTKAGILACIVVSSSVSRPGRLLSCWGGVVVDGVSSRVGWARRACSPYRSSGVDETSPGVFAAAFSEQMVLECFERAKIIPCYTDGDLRPEDHALCCPGSSFHTESQWGLLMSRSEGLSTKP